MASMLPDGRRLGAHLALGPGMVRTIDRAATIGATALQVFTADPKAWDRDAIPSAELSAFRARLAEAGIAPLVIHAPYLVNLAASDAAYHERSVVMLAAELGTARRMGASIVNAHIGSHGGAGVAAGIDRLVAAVGEALNVADDGVGRTDRGDGAAGSIGAGDLAVVDDPAGLGPPAIIALENSPGGRSALGVDLDELAAIADALDVAGIPRGRIGFCLDTAHAWSAGVDLGDPTAIDAFLDVFDARIGLDRLVLVHLNDSKSERGSGVDRHEHLGGGRIGETGLGHLLREPRLFGATWILETPGMDAGYDAINVRRAMALARGERLEPLPEGALTLKGSRSRAALASDVGPLASDVGPVASDAGPLASDPAAS